MSHAHGGPQELGFSESPVQWREVSPGWALPGPPTHTPAVRLAGSALGNLRKLRASLGLIVRGTALRPWIQLWGESWWFWKAVTQPQEDAHSHLFVCSFHRFRIADVTGICPNACGGLHWTGFPDSFQLSWSKLEPLNDLEMVKTVYLALMPMCFSLLYLTPRFFCQPQLNKGPQMGFVQFYLSAW